MDERINGRTIVIGDIHGCAHALETLLDEIRPSSEDLIVSLGDFVDTGRETSEVVQQLISLEKRCRFVALMGNHEEMLLGALTSEQLKQTWMMCGGVSTLNSYRFGGDLDSIPDEHWDFVRRCREFYETNTHIFVHANYVADLALDQQPEHVLRWSLFEEPYPEPHHSGKTVVVGHTEQRDGEILDLGHVLCIDTYCHGYGWLTAVDVNSGKVWQASRWGALRDGEDLEGLKRAKKMISQ